MFVCLECGSTFEELAHWEEHHGLDAPPYERWCGSPCCYGGYAKTYKCDHCGKWIVGQYVKIENGERYCWDCHIPLEVGEEE